MLRCITVAVLVLSALGLDDASRDFYNTPSAPSNDVFTGYFLEEAAQLNGAVCLDGSPSVYYHRPGTGDGATKYYIHLEGGGWCVSVADCAARALTDLGTSKGKPATQDYNFAYFSNNATVNPLMHNWNSVFVHYCDGGSFSGSADTTTEYNGQTIHFRGKQVLQAVMDDLMVNRAMSEASDVVVSGCSAGGLAAFMHTDYVASILPSAKVVGLPDSGFFMDYQDGYMNYHSQMDFVYTQMNASSGLNQACIAARPADPQLCMFAQHMAPHIKSPIFPLQSKYDSWQVPYDLGEKDFKDAVAINVYGQYLLEEFGSQFLNKPQNGVFLDACFHHCGSWNEISINGLTSSVAFQKWYNGERSVNIQYEPYPCEDCCHL